MVNHSKPPLPRLNTQVSLYPPETSNTDPVSHYIPQAIYAIHLHFSERDTISVSTPRTQHETPHTRTFKPREPRQVKASRQRSSSGSRQKLSRRNVSPQTLTRDLQRAKNRSSAAEDVSRSPTLLPAAPQHLRPAVYSRTLDPGCSSSRSLVRPSRTLHDDNVDWHADHRRTVSPWTSPLRQGASSSTPRSRRISCGDDSDLAQPTDSGDDNEEEGASVYASFSEDEEHMLADSEEGAAVEEAWGSDRDADETSSISSNEIVDMPPPRSARTLRSPLPSPLMDRVRRRRVSSTCSRMEGGFRGTSPSPSPMTNSRIHNGVTDLASGHEHTEVDESGTASSQESISDVEFPGETRLEKALSERWMKDRTKRCLSGQGAKDTRSSTEPRHQRQVDGYGTF